MPRAPDQPAANMRQRLARFYNIDGELPEVVRRPMRWSLVVPGLGLLGLAALIALDATGVIARPYPGATFGIVGVTIACVWLCHRVAKNVLRRVAAHDHLLCPECTYDLRTLDAAGTCPECGRAYEHEAVRAQWLDAQRRLKRT